MNKIRFELNRAGVRELLRSEKAADVCAEYGKRIQARCGDGYNTDTYTGRNRVNAMVWAETPKAKKDNSANNTLLKAMR